MDLYQNHYTQLGFERAGLFKTIRDTYSCRDALYPGCSVHVTPSLYFPHVIYVDQSETAAHFFADENVISDFVSRHKHYKRSAYIRFIQQDYSLPLPLKEGTFDLLISLFAGGIARSCGTYLKRGGLLLTNNHQNDAIEAANSERFNLVATIRFQRGSYCISTGREGTKLPVQKLNKKYLKRAHDAVQYVENETYSVFEYLH